MSSPNTRIRGIDSIRFICALWVVFFHGNSPPITSLLDRANGVQRILAAFLDCLFCGPAAVIVFFVISGFCIHYPYATKRAPKALPFIIRRFTRIGLPTLAAVILSVLILGEVMTMWRLLLWSLYCEVVYYSIYPLLYKISRAKSWIPILGGSAITCIGLTIFSGSSGMYARMDFLDPLLGLPCWILGCILAERFAKKSKSAITGQIWLWRMGAWGLSSLCYGLMLHTPLGFRVTLPFFAIYSYFWLSAELNHPRKETSLFRTLELLGTASFTLYLTHPLAVKIYQQIHSGFGPDSSSAVWIFKLLAIIAFSSIFYLLIERPSHQLARRMITSPQKE